MASIGRLEAIRKINTTLRAASWTAQHAHIAIGGIHQPLSRHSPKLRVSHQHRVQAPTACTPGPAPTEGAMRMCSHCSRVFKGCPGGGAIPL